MPTMKCLQILSDVAIAIILHCRFGSGGGLALAFSTTTPTVPNQSKSHRHLTTMDAVPGQPDYTIAGSNLSEKWVELVRDGKVSATVEMMESNGDKAHVTYGVRLVQQRNNEEQAFLSCEEFVLAETSTFENSPSQSTNACHEKIKSINATLAELQTQSLGTASGSAVKYVLDNDDFAAQLQLVRTLRPPPSAGFAGSTSSVPPPYDAEQDSFVTGPLRLELRPLVATLRLPIMTTGWDVFHNVSPCDSRGHFLLVPSLTDEAKNWRGQSFLADDCNDLVHLASSIKPVGSLLLGYNSVGAGASQNHIHCHAWPSPPVPLIPTDTDSDGTAGWDCYAASKVTTIFNFCDAFDGDVEVSFLEYPVFCIQLSASEPNLTKLGEALAATLKSIGDAPYNIGFLNRVQVDEDDEGSVTSPVDVYVFVRSKERSDILPSLKLGISEMMGVFHAQSDAELEQLVPDPKTSFANEEDSENKRGQMFKALEDISFQDTDSLWNKIKDNLENLLCEI
jgi:hypothetical protein